MYVRPGVVARELGVTTKYLKRLAREGRLPTGSVLATEGGHYTYDLILVRQWMRENFERQTRISRLTARLHDHQSAG
ncbi:MAG: hypothetical protein LIP77_10775 [Planctomycetes bacterium]|nr:hypothetical protein [Planctomycetota bacterium]